MFDGILFDLDGTLWDAVEQLAESWSGELVRFGVDRGPITAQELRPCMGMLLPDIAKKLLPQLPEERQLEVIRHCCEAECEHLIRHSGTLYPGEEETLALLKEQCPLFVVSNCQDGYIQAFYEGTGLGGYFVDFECAGRTGRPKNENIALMVERHGLKNPVYVGDTQMDCEAARAAGVAFLHAAYGFGRVEGVPAIHSFRELPEALEKLG